MDHLDVVGDIVGNLSDLGLAPVMVGGMALVILGSRRVTRDFDFVVAQPGDRLGSLLDVFYARGLELVSRLSDDDEMVATIGNRKVASARLRLDAPASASFFSRKTGLRVDLLFDYPVGAARLKDKATKITVRSQGVKGSESVSETATLEGGRMSFLVQVQREVRNDRQPLSPHSSF